MLTRRDWLIVAALLLVITGVVLAETAFVKSNDARLTDSKRAFGATTVALLRGNEEVEVLEGTIGAYDWCRIRITRDGESIEGYVRGTALRAEPLEVDVSALDEHDPNYVNSVGAASKGWNQQMEDEYASRNPDFAGSIENVKEFVGFLDENLRKSPNDYFSELDRFHREGGLGQGRPSYGTVEGGE